MEVTGSRFTAHNISTSFEHNEDIHEYFQLNAPPKSTIWRKHVTRDEISAPMILTSLTQPFMVAEVTVSVDLDVEWDQAGLVIFAGTSPTAATTHSSIAQRRRASTLITTPPEHIGGKWVKASLELTSGDPGMSTVVTNPNCGPDVSFVPICPCSEGNLPTLRVKLERVDDDLWVWYRIPELSAISLEFREVGEVSLEWRKAREIYGFFTGINAKLEVKVGCYASRPMPLEEDEKNSLFAEFEDLEIL